MNGNYQKAIETVNELIENQSVKPVDFYIKERLILNLGHLDETIKDCDRIPSISPG